MISLEQIKNFFPPQYREDLSMQKYMIKEYIQLMVLDFLSSSQYIRKIVFIGGTNLRLVKGIDRFSEDLDFDCKDLKREEFMQMTDDIIVFLERSGLNVETRDKENAKLKAFRRNLYFPSLLFELGLSGHKEERFLVKIESQDQGVQYLRKIVNVKKLGFFFPIPVPPDEILCAMKLSALISRQKGRDFYDAMYLLGMVEPDYDYLSSKNNIHNKEELKAALKEVALKTNLQKKCLDFEHLLFNKTSSKKILLFKDFVETL